MYPWHLLSSLGILGDYNPQMSSVFFCVVAPIHWETDLREAYASLRGVKGSLRRGVLFGVAYAGGYARIFFASRSEEVSFK